jgi:tetratricopeptide (TPR) repeat protein
MKVNVMKNKWLLYIFIFFVIIYPIIFAVNSSRSEYLLIKGDFMFLGRSIKDKKLVTCHNKLIPIDSGKIIKVTTKCQNNGGIWAQPVAFNINILLNESYNLMEKHEYIDAQKMLDLILEKDPGNPLALNNLASIMVAEKKFDKAETYLKQALPRARLYTVQVNRVCSVSNICLAFKPAQGGTGNQNLEDLIKVNIEMVKGYMTAGPLPGSGLRPK